jgi:hypothetical protein
VLVSHVDELAEHYLWGYLKEIGSDACSGMTVVFLAKM